MKALFKSDYSLLVLVLCIAFLIIMVMMVVAILKIPVLVRYQKAQLKLTLLMAKQQGIDRDTLYRIVTAGDDEMKADADVKQL